MLLPYSYIPFPLFNTITVIHSTSMSVTNPYILIIITLYNCISFKEAEVRMGSNYIFIVFLC